MFCAKCGTANPDGAHFCNKCGATLGPAASANATPPAYAANPQYPAAHPAPYVGPTQTSPKAIGSLVCGIFFFIFPAAVLAIIFGHWSLSDIRKSAGRFTGRGMATAGLVLGYLGIAMIPLLLIVAAIAIPNLLRARMAANEASAVNTLRAMNTALVIYGSDYSNGFPSNLEVLTSGDPAAGNCNHAALLDRIYARGTKNGYVFHYAPVFPENRKAPAISPKASAANCSAGGASGYEITADPLNPNQTGVRHFYTDQSGLIRWSRENGPATADSDPLE
jgi:type IV pilus assembly protein PilA